MRRGPEIRRFDAKAIGNSAAREGGEVMGNIVRWNPFRELEEVQNRLNRMFNDTRTRTAGEEPFIFADWTPAVDIRETDKEYSVKVDLPEVNREDVKVELLDGTLTIRGERRQEKEENGEKFHRIEREYGHFVRRFMLPGEVDPSRVEAHFKEGVLKVTMPKSAATIPKPVEVKVA